MSIFAKLFKKKKEAPVPVPQEPIRSSHPMCGQLEALTEYMETMLAEEHYIAKSEFLGRLEADKPCVEFFKVLENSGTLESFCAANGIQVEAVTAAMGRYAVFEELIDRHNDAYIDRTMEVEREYLDGILSSVDPQIKLDEDQRRVILTDEDYCLVIAGAGAGKTTTVAAKVKYLVEKKGVQPSQILVVSFTNKAVNELKEKINRDLDIPCPIATFHSTGNAILRKQTEEKLHIVDSTKLFFVIQDYFRSSILKNESLVNNLILFFASYFEAPYEGADLNDFFNNIAKANFSSLRSDLNEFKQQVIDLRTKKAVTIQSEVMRSAQEVEIANFLYLHNVDYEYEPIYKYDIQFARKPYTPDFVLRQGDKTVYLEHFGITQDGRNDRFSSDELEAYKRAINDKIKLHKKHGTELIYTFSSYNDRRPLLDHLKEDLEACGFDLTPRSNREVMEKLVTSEENRYIRKLVNLICRFIGNFKTNGYTADEFTRMYHSTQNVRTRLFLDICHDCYLEYDRYLKENNAVDFEDMINESARMLREVKEMKQKLDFRYVIVDEYQDISRQRFDLVTALSDVTEAKIIAVGDDWQSIYAFSGSDVTLFTRFAEKMGYAKLLKIVRTYRNSQEVIDIAGNFIQKNEAQISKELTSPKRIQDPVIIYTYDGTYKKANDNNRSGANYAMAHAVEVALEQIMAYNQAEGKPVTSSILLLGRFGFDGDRLEKSGLFEYIERGSKIKSVKYPRLNITFMTAHASKGLGYDNVIVVNGRNETYGFPSKIEDDPVLAFVIKGDRSIDHAEERRLFYVAMTRTKNRVFFIAPEQNPSEFLLEIKRDYRNVVLRGSWNEEEPENRFAKKSCPICGYPLQYRYKNSYGLRLHICTNEPEICGFMTNDYKGGKLSIMKCDQCRDGYLIVKPSKTSGYFLGCSNYQKDGTGCAKSISPNVYYEMMRLTPDPAPAVVFPKARDKQPKVSVEQGKPVSEKPTAMSAKDTAPIPSETQKEPTSDQSLGITEEMKASPTVKENPTTPVPAENVTAKALPKKVLHAGRDLNQTVGLTLACLSHMSESKYYGVTTLVDILRGSQSKRLLSAKLDQIPEYGVLCGMKREDLSALVEWLIENHYILQTKGPYPVLHPTYDGMHYAETITVRKLEKLKEYLESERTEE